MFKGEIEVGQHIFMAEVPNKYTQDKYYALAAETVSAWTLGEHMLPKTPDDISELFAAGHSVLIFNKNKLVGHGAITAEYTGKKIEIGSIIVSPNHRHEGVGTAATIAVLYLAKHAGYEDWTVFALANPQSAKLFEKMGASPMSTSELGAEPWAYCVTCPKLPKQSEGQPFICCDTPYNLTPLIELTSSLVKKWHFDGSGYGGVNPNRGQYDTPGCYR